MIQYLLDENLRGPLWNVIQRHNARGIDPIQAVRVGDSNELQIGTTDDQILEWCESNQHILVTYDKSSMPSHLQSHLARGRNCPGIFMLHESCTWMSVLDFLVLAVYASEEFEWVNAIRYV